MTAANTATPNARATVTMPGDREIHIERIVRSFEWGRMPGHVIIETSDFEDLGDGRTKLVSTSLFHTREA
jgi:hypothetical protein